LVKRYGGRTVVDDVSLTVCAGEIVALVGRNGAGKSTAIRIAAGLVAADQGHVRLQSADGQYDMDGVPLERYGRMGLAYLSQRGSLFSGLSIYENLVGTLELLGSRSGAGVGADVDAHMQRLRIAHVAHLKPAQMSFGQRRLAGLARVLIGAPKVLLFDEPFAGLDPLTIGHVKAILRGLRERGTAILVSDHNARELSEIADRVYVLVDGRVELEGPMAGMRDNPRAEKLYFAGSLKPITPRGLQ
jgi:lipopolysaccharide export system ATP-binding protein